MQEMLKSPYVDVRMTLADMLRSRKQSAVRDELAKDLCADDEIRVRNIALRMLSTIRPEGWVDLLMLALQEEENRELRDAAAIALCSAPKDAKVLEVLKAYLPDASPIVARRIEIYVRLYDNAMKRGGKPAK